MGINLVSILAAITVMLLIAEALTLPVDIPQANGEQDANMAEDKRPKYMETRDLSAFKDLVLYAMEKLAAEGRINPELLVSSSESAPEGAVERRGRHLGLCVRRRGSTLTPYPCWKADSE